MTGRKVIDMGSLTIDDIQDKLENAIPELLLVWNGEWKPMIIDLDHNMIVAYTHHKRWILKDGISEYTMHIAAIRSLLEQWDGQI